jgi:hypothetical protein
MGLGFMSSQVEREREREALRLKNATLLIAIRPPTVPRKCLTFFGFFFFFGLALNIFLMKNNFGKN